jgi:hypothetical protein
LSLKIGAEANLKAQKTFHAHNPRSGVAFSRFLLYSFKILAIPHLNAYFCARFLGIDLIRLGVLESFKQR